MTSPYPELRGRVAIITGAARGIGLAAVQRFASCGATIVAFDLPNSDMADAQAVCADAKVPSLMIAGDVSLVEDWKRATRAAMDAFGRIDVLVNNAGISGPVAPLLDYPDDAFDQVQTVNARSVFIGMKYTANLMKERGGSIVNISSVSGIGGGRYVIGYTASKHAVVGMTKLAAAELAPLNIRVNALCPAPTATEMMFAFERKQSPDDPEAVRKGMSQMIPMGRYGTPEEIANAVLFLASDAASFITGVALPVDGGLKAS
jgi:3alpha(or 20beta)-hydroxysteroid dehydrogenase